MTDETQPGSTPTDQPFGPPQQGYQPYAHPVAPYGWAPPATSPPAGRRGPLRRTMVGAGTAVVAAGLVLSGFAIANSTMSTDTASGTLDPASSAGTGTGSSSSGSTGSGSTGSGSAGSGSAGSGVIGGGLGSGSIGGSGTGTGTGTGTGQTSAQVATSTEQAGIVTVVSVLKYQNEEAAGTGLVLSSDGEILTNNHVIDGATSVTVTVKSTGKSYSATVVGTDPTDDVAVLQLKGASGLTTAKVGSASDVSALTVGTSVAGVGNAGGTGTLTVATGTVTDLDQSITASDEDGQNSEKLTGLIETDAGIMAGDSGGPLYDSDGTIIGMDTAGSTGTATQGTTQAYAIPIDTALSIAGKIESGVQTTSIHIGLPAFLGVGAEDSTTGGAAITTVVDGGPAATAGITAGSVITSVGGKAVTSAASLGTALGNYSPGQQVSVTWTDTSGQSHTAEVTLISGPAD